MRRVQDMLVQSERLAIRNGRYPPEEEKCGACTGLHRAAFKTKFKRFTPLELVGERREISQDYHYLRTELLIEYHFLKSCAGYRGRRSNLSTQLEVTLALSYLIVKSFHGRLEGALHSFCRACIDHLSGMPDTRHR
jgi:hypothetical protein